MPSIDLHCHSFFSDGTQSPSQLVQQALNAQLQYLALTDHDSVNGLAEAHQAAQGTSLTIINGVEVSAVWQKQLIHIIGLGIDQQNTNLLAGLAEQAQARAKRGKLIAEKLHQLGITDTWSEVLALAEGDENRVGRAHFAQCLLNRGVVNNLQKAFDNYLATGKPAAVPMPWTDMLTAITWIQQSGGVAVLAHPARYNLSQTKLRALLLDFKQAGGQAMEVNTASEKINVINNLANLSQRFELYASQGSDYHGTTMPWLKLGHFAEQPSICKPVWQLLNINLN